MRKAFVGLVSVAAVLTLVSLRGANTFTLVGGGSSPVSTGDTFVGMSPDASRIYFETTEQLLSGDTDSTYDVYRWTSGGLTQISLGNGNNGYLTDAQFLGESADGSRMYFQTRESLNGSDTDNEVDIYQNAGGVITLLSGSGGFPATFMGVYGTTVFFETQDALDVSDTDTFVDVYSPSGGAPSLVTGGTPDADAFFKAASPDGSAVIVQTAAAIHANDTNGMLDLYRLQGGNATLLTSGTDSAFAVFVGASIDLSRVFFRTSGLDGDGFDDVYESYNGQITLISGTTDDHLVLFKGASADGTRVFLSAEKPLAGEADDGANDIYEASGGVITRLTGAGSSPVQFHGSSSDGTRMFFSTADPLDPADVDAAYDVYEAMGGVRTLLSGGSATCAVPQNLGTCDAFFAGATADGTSVLLQTREGLTVDDTDGGHVDYYVASGGVLTLRTPGGGIAGAELGAVGTFDMSVVVFTTADTITPDDQDASADIYRSVAPSSPTDVTPPTVNCEAADGQWHADNVTMACTASDAESGLADPQDASFTLSTSVADGTEDGNASTSSRTVLDVAGNSAVAQVGGNKIDRKAPTVSVTTPAVNAVYSQGQAVTANYSCTDGGSGVATCAGPVASGQGIDTSSTGVQSFSVTGTDTVGNSSVVTVSYSVVGATVTPVFGGFPDVLLPVLISNCGTLESPVPCTGDQFDPHVSGDLASYTAGNNVRYYNFLTGDDRPIDPLTDAVDNLSDVSGPVIVFARLGPDGRNPVMAHQTQKDYTVEIDAQPNAVRISPAVGGSTVAFIDLGLTAGGELRAWRLSGVPDRLTDDTRLDRRPSVAPSGHVIVYESCASSVSNCDIRQATWNGSAWTVTPLSDNTEHESNPDSDDVVVVYDAVRGGERDICWQPVGGGTEQRLVLPGEQRNPSVSGGLISFESKAVGETQADLFVYHIATNRLFQITSTPLDDSLNDVSTLANGQFRLVWSEGPIGNRDVRGATIELPSLVDDYQFGGFRAPVNPFPVLNSMKAGGAVPVKFSLGGNRGLDIFAAGYPMSQVIPCDSSAPQDGVEQIVTAGGSGLTYDATTDTYSYVWKTNKAWAGTCRQLVMQFKDGDVARANFLFK